MKKYKEKFLRMVKRFEELGHAPNFVKTEEGLSQFHKYESTGIKPTNPDPYFLHLLDGKGWWEWTLNQYLEAWPKNWYGWYCYALDFRDDPEGFKMVRQRMQKVWPNLDINVTPEQIIKEMESIVDACGPERTE